MLRDIDCILTKLSWVNSSYAAFHSLDAQVIWSFVRLRRMSDSHQNPILIVQAPILLRAFGSKSSSDVGLACWSFALGLWDVDSALAGLVNFCWCFQPHNNYTLHIQLNNRIIGKYRYWVLALVCISAYSVQRSCLVAKAHILRLLRLWGGLGYLPKHLRFSVKVQGFRGLGFTRVY